MELSERQQSAITEAQSALRETLKAAYPEDFPVLFVAAVTGMFAALVHGELAAPLIKLVNAELRGAGANLILQHRYGFGSARNQPLSR
jgi:hypothetical protein